MNLKNKLFNKPFYFRIAAYLLILLGITIRIYHYLINRSLWLDEAMLSNNIIARNFAGLLEPLDSRQIAPIGFLYVQKIFTILFGENEYALRLLPLLCGILSVIFFYLLLKQVTNEKIVLLGLIFFVFGRYLLYYSNEAKQYNLDLLIYIVFFYLFYYKSIIKSSYIKLFALGLLGGVFCLVFPSISCFSIKYRSISFIRVLY